MSILIVVDHAESGFLESARRAVTAATAIGGDIHLLLAGSKLRDAAEQLRRISGVDVVLMAEYAQLDRHLAEPMVELLDRLAANYDVLSAPAGTSGKNVMPRLAARLDVMQISEVVGVVAPDMFERPIYAGAAIATVRSSDRKLVLTIRTSAFLPAPLDGSATVRELPASIGPSPTRLVSVNASASERPDLGSARVVVAGGRALGSKESFEALILPLAERLNAAVGASRAAVDAGFVSSDCQVGQTGKIVAPDIYLACGISGAIQHLAGMKASKMIVAINKDPEAPIFEISDYGLIADVFEAIPELTRQLQA
jgi:electron transfer flavoprotein alpha subunit